MRARTRDGRSTVDEWQVRCAVVDQLGSGADMASLVAGGTALCVVPGVGALAFELLERWGRRR